MQIRDRIKELRRVKASDLRRNPKNWRTHSPAQLSAIRGVLGEIGFAGAELAREDSDGSLILIDGHARAEVSGDSMVPVLVLDVNEAEADKLLATFDPLGAMAGADSQKLEELLAEVSTEDDALRAMLDAMAEEHGAFDVEEIAPPELATGDRQPYQQMTFTLHDSQAAVVKKALEIAKSQGGFEDSPNENSNGNALARIAEAFCGSG